jgi:hypothetical protein
MFTAPELADSNQSGPAAIYGPAGIPNLLAYALGLDPRQPVSPAALPVFSVAGPNALLTYQRPSARTDVTYQVEASTDLVSWSVSGVSHTQTATSGGVETWQATHALNPSGGVFLHLKVSLP